MAIKGNGYIKTTWAFQERPVSSAKLNQWDDGIEAALELTFFLLNQAWGGGSGVIRGATGYDLCVTAQSPPAMGVEVKPGYAFISSMPFKLAAPVELTEAQAPAANPRIDLVEVRLDRWQAAVKQGTESSVPPTPEPDVDCIALAKIYLRPGMTCIKNTDDGINGYLIDQRTFL